MLLDISRLRTEAVEVNRRFEPEAFADLKEDFRVVGPTGVAGTVRRVDAAAVVLQCRLTSTMEVTCGRCLEPFSVPVDAEVETRFVPPAELARVTAETAAGAVRHDAGGLQPDVDDAVVGLAEYRDDSIDLAGVVREQWYLALPMKPLCREDCQGLCPVCGVNRNRETCACRQEWGDPRMAVLAEWKSRNERTKG